MISCFIIILMMIIIVIVNDVRLIFVTVKKYFAGACICVRPIHAVIKSISCSDMLTIVLSLSISCLHSLNIKSLDLLCLV